MNKGLELFKKLLSNSVTNFEPFKPSFKLNPFGFIKINFPYLMKKINNMILNQVVKGILLQSLEVIVISTLKAELDFWHRLANSTPRVRRTLVVLDMT